ncbi:hypothetical protein [Streptomyces lydicus]|uniref:hypothetical protein n=1 Tax=Streptomyces lydicus TaxID=47763 RepID=UPI0036EE4F72
MRWHRGGVPDRGQLSAVAARIALGDADLSAYDEERRLPPPGALRAELDRAGVDPAMDSGTEPLVSSTTQSGTRHRQQVTDPLGSPTNPLGRAAILAKFHQLAPRSLPTSQARASPTWRRSCAAPQDSEALVGAAQGLAGKALSDRIGTVRQSPSSAHVRAWIRSALSHASISALL